MPSRLHRASIVALFPAVLAVGLLAGCGTGGAAGGPTTSAPSPTSGGSEEPSAEPTDAGTPTPTAEPATPITFGCDDLLTSSDIYEFNANVGAAPDYEPTADTVVADAAAASGLACGYVNQTSGELIEVAVAQPSESEFVSLKQTAASTMTAVPTYGTPPAVDGFFTQSQDIGTVQVFTADGYWLVARSTAFFEPGDAGKIIEPALTHLP
ncbi:MAG: hypothetical protein ABWY53_05850 [Leifsonia flava]